MEPPPKKKDPRWTSGVSASNSHQLFTWKNERHNSKKYDTPELKTFIISYDHIWDAFVGLISNSQDSCPLRWYFVSFTRISTEKSFTWNIQTSVEFLASLVDPRPNGSPNQEIYMEKNYPLAWLFTWRGVLFTSFVIKTSTAGWYATLHWVIPPDFISTSQCLWYDLHKDSASWKQLLQDQKVWFIKTTTPKSNS